jgi:plasmid stabilization system protein ParE
MVIWTPHARADLKAIHDHIAKDSPLNAKKIMREMVQKPDLLSAAIFLIGISTTATS